MTRTVRVLILVLGLGAVAFLIWYAGPQVVFRMLAHAGWSLPAIVGIYAVHVATRAVALWRCVLSGGVRYTHVLGIRLSGEAVEMLTFTGPFLAEPAKGWLLKRRGLTTADAFAAVVTEYLLYTVVSSCLTIAALWLLLMRGSLPPAVRPAAAVVMALTIAFVAAFAFAVMTGIGLIVPVLRASRLVIGTARSERAAHEFGRVEDVIIRFLHGHRGRLAEVLAIEAAAHMLLVTEIWIVLTTLGYSLPWTDPFIVEGGRKITTAAFAFVPGQFGASEGMYALLAGAIGLPAAAGLTLALVRRIRGLLVASAGVVVLALFGDR
ncbi:MAG TPA: lysylphosphatidylglycerol synthase domain-containing protein [Vicinamibacterales bacterium]|nr:lysylphosphatidylglycerol synthase domain-containing protein [Vicinamibacterales bacterium]